MAIDRKTRHKLITILTGTNYRRIIADRCGCHPNTVANVLYGRCTNSRVELELLILGKETKEQADQAAEIAKQL